MIFSFSSLTSFRSFPLSVFAWWNFASISSLLILMLSSWNFKTIQWWLVLVLVTITNNNISNGPTLTRSFVSLKVSELLLFLSALRNFFFRNLVHGKLSNWQGVESHLQVILRLPTEAFHQDDAVSDCCHPSISCLLVVSNLRCHRSVCLLVLIGEWLTRSTGGMLQSSLKTMEKATSLVTSDNLKKKFTFKVENVGFLHTSLESAFLIYLSISFHLSRCL